MDKDALKSYSLFFITVIGIFLIAGGIATLVTSFIDDDEPDDTWSDFAEKSNEYTDYTVEKFKGYGSCNVDATSARIIYTSGDKFDVKVYMDSYSLRWYYLFADDKGIRIEYHVMNRDPTPYADRISSIQYIPYESILSVYVNNLPSEY